MINIIVSRVTEDGIFLEGEEPGSVINIEPKSGLIPVHGLNYRIKAALVNNNILVTGSARMSFKCSCDNCLAEFELKIANEAICHLYEKANVSEIDLTEDIREDILISLPHRILCRKNCKGLCFKCGQNLNLKKCSCPERKNKNLNWEELNKLKF